MKECKCKCGGCAKKGGAVSLDSIYKKGGYTVEELKALWKIDYYENLLKVYSKLINNLQDSNKIILIIISFCSIKDLTNIKKLYDYFDLSKSKITIQDIKYIGDAIINNIQMEPFFVIKISNAYNHTYDMSFTQEILKQNLIQYDFYQASITTNIHDIPSFNKSLSLSSLISINSGNNIEFIKNPLNWNNTFVSAHVMIVKDIYTANKKMLMLTHMPTSIRGTLVETDCRLGIPGGNIDSSDYTPWTAMLREYKEEAELDFPINYKLINTFIWEKKHIIFLVNTDDNIDDFVINNEEIYSRKWFSIKELKDIIQSSSKGSKQVKGSFKMRNGAINSTDAIIKLMAY
jgi:hypothetical protein